MFVRQKINLCLLLLVFLGSGCALVEDGAPKLSTGLIATPVNYYSTPKARYLGTKYKENLDRIAERIVRNPETAQLQFANNISSVGGIGFFTHSATTTPDERYLEVVLATPETFETKGEYSDKVHRLFSRYGSELLAMIAGERQIFQDKELSGYGLNFTWRTVVSEAGSSRVGLARAIIYFHKQKVADFLRQGLSEGELLREAVIFAVEDNGPLELVSYQARETQPDFRPAIREDNLPPVVAKPTPLADSATTRRGGTETIEAKPSSRTKEPVDRRSGDMLPSAASEKPEKKDAPAAKKKLPMVSGPEQSRTVAKQSSPTKDDKDSDKVAFKHDPTEAISASSSPAKPQPSPTPTASGSPPSGSAARASGAIKGAEKSKASNLDPGDPPAQLQSRESMATEKTAEIRAEQSTGAGVNTLTSKPDAEMARTASKPVAPIVLAKRPAEAATVEPRFEGAPPESAALPHPVLKAPSPPAVRETEEKKLPEPASSLGKRQDLSKTETVPATMPVPRQPSIITKQSQPVASPKPETLPSIGKTPASVMPAEAARPLESRPMESVTAHAAEKKTSEVREIARAPLRPPAAVGEQEEKKVSVPTSSIDKLEDVAKTETVPAPAMPAKQSRAAANPSEAAPSAKPEAAVSVGKTPTVVTPPDVAKPLETKPAASLPKVKGEKKPSGMKEIARTPLPPPVVSAAPKSAPEPLAKSTAPALSSPRETGVKDTAVIEPPVREPSPVPESMTLPVPSAEVDKPVGTPAESEPVPPAVRENAADKPAAEQLALLRKPHQTTVKKRPLVRPIPRSLEGFIIQVSFSDKERALNWAEKMEQKGFAVSVTEAGAGGALRVRLGNFPGRDAAERQLRNFKKEGMNGIVINLPQAFRPGARASLP